MLSIQRMPDPVVIAADLVAELNAFLKNQGYSKIGVITDENTRRHCYPLIAKRIPEHFSISVPAGEEHKNIDTCIKIWQALTDEAVDRHSILLVLGGGVLGDMAGFCAATFKRGIGFMLMPTTLLAQVDASIGGKLGVDFNSLKNHIGVFALPALTLIHTGFLQTLPQQEYRSGFAEIIKHALISDVEVWNKIKSSPIGSQPLDYLIRHSIAFKSKVTAHDPKEKGLRKVLNAGHTIGHALESHLMATDHKVLHGEAIAAGLIAEAWISVEKGFLSPTELQEISRYIIDEFGKIKWAPGDEEAIARLTVQDKKNKGNKVLCVLLEGIGKARWDCEISPPEVKGALSFYRSI